MTKFLAALKTLSFNKRSPFNLNVSVIYCNYNFDDNVELESLKFIVYLSLPRSMLMICHSKSLMTLDV